MDIDRYFDRICFEFQASDGADGIAAMQHAHRMMIGFENLDVMLGQSIRIDAESVFDKLVNQGRGGYCFEHNRLFSDVLTRLGISNRPLLARTRLGQTEGYVPPRTHVAILAEIEGDLWLTDAGFGGSNLAPLRLEDGAQTQTSDGAKHRLISTGERGSLWGEWLLERAGPSSATDGRAADHSGWQPQYSFDLTQVAPDDLEQANHWTSTRPDTRFKTLHVVSIPLKTGFASMVDRSLTLSGMNRVERRFIKDASEYSQVLSDIFNITLSVEDVARLPLFASRFGSNFLKAGH